MSQFEINQKSQCCGGEFDYDAGKKLSEKCIMVPEVIGRNICQTLVECVVPFPEQYPAVEIKDIQKEIRDIIVHVCKNKVLINGILHKNINYKTYEGKSDFYYACQRYDSFYGDVRHVAVNIPFACFIEIPGARPGDDYEIEYADVEDSCEIDILEDPIWQKGAVTQYRKLREKVIVKIDIKVLRNVQITVKPEKHNICP
ncbi:DUF3794 domain-containing protein [Ruminiclostridium josui]|uniref:DUF3794 domain-containing protein n=1 Tax=Ruminiclostridium josui TaxID=1499 RepID=UPI0004644B21|nr:DUF3794 domain-containing protein [Ruminiclostridium josui]